MKPKTSNTVVTGILVLLCLVGVISLQLPLLQARSKALTHEDYLTEQRDEALTLATLQKMPSLGFDNLLSDWSFMKFIQYFGDNQARDAIGYSLVPDYFQVLVDHDPMFIQAYFYLQPATTLFAGRPDRSVESIQLALDKVDPQDAPSGTYYLWLYKAIDELLFLGRIESAWQSYNEAARWAIVENTPESRAVAESARESATFLQNSNRDIHKAQIGAWLQILNNTSDQRVQEFAIQQIEKLGGRVTRQ